MYNVKPGEIFGVGDGAFGGVAVRGDREEIECSRLISGCQIEQCATGPASSRHRRRASQQPCDRLTSGA